MKYRKALAFALIAVLITALILLGVLFADMTTYRPVPVESGVRYGQAVRYKSGDELNCPKEIEWIEITP